MLALRTTGAATGCTGYAGSLQGCALQPSGQYALVVDDPGTGTGSFALNAEVACFSPPLFDRTATVHRVIEVPGDPGLDDALDNFNPQASSQWDSLAHVPYAPDTFYNGATLEDVLRGGRNTVDHWARRGIAIANQHYVPGRAPDQRPGYESGRRAPLST